MEDLFDAMHIAALEVEHDGLGATLATIATVAGVVEERVRLVGGGREEAAELAGDFAVASGDYDTHPLD